MVERNSIIFGENVALPLKPDPAFTVIAEGKDTTYVY